MAFSKRLRREADRRTAQGVRLETSTWKSTTRDEREEKEKFEKETNYVSPKKERAKAMLRKGLLSRVEHLLQVNRSFPIAVRQLHAAIVRPENRVQKTNAEKSRGEHYLSRINNRAVTVKHMKKSNEAKHKSMVETSRMHYREKLGLPIEKPVIAKKLRRKFRAKSAKPKNGDYR